MKKICRFSIVIVVLLFFFFIRSCNAQNLYWCSNYHDMEYDVQVTSVITLKGDSLRTYLHPVGYVWWHVDKGGANVSNKQIIEKGELFLSNPIAKSFIYISSNIVVQLIFIDGRVFTIEFRPNEKRNNP